MTREQTAIDHIANEYVRKVAQRSPLFATHAGLEGDHGSYDDFSPAGLEAAAQDARETLRQVNAQDVVDDVDRITVSAMNERLGLSIEIFESGWEHADLNVIASAPQSIRDVYDLMPTETADDWATIARRLNNVPGAISGYLESLRHGAANGKVAAARQFEEVIAQAEKLAGDDSFFTTLTARGATSEAAASNPSLAVELEAGASQARAGYAELIAGLKELAAQAPPEDAVGRERYSLMSRYFLGTQVDLDETYEWGIAHLQSIIDEQQQVAETLGGPGTSVAEAIAQLSKDPARILHGTDALQAWMQRISDEAIQALADTHFDIPEPVKKLECMIAPSNSGGIYYTGPSADFTRPGRMWWSVPEGETTFETWQEKTTVYHEGVPGHHLQVGQTVYRAELLNEWRRMFAWVSGHGEGWALYAERLMADLGFQDDPGDRMGMLDSQRLRAARVVLDIGVHLGKDYPAQFEHMLTETVGGTWNARNAWEFLRSNAAMGEGFLRFELNRYLGWPGQAPSYKIGQRIWEEIRDATQAAEGENFSLKDFHRRALDVGGVGLDTLREALLGDPALGGISPSQPQA